MQEKCEISRNCVQFMTFINEIFHKRFKRKSDFAHIWWLTSFPDIIDYAIAKDLAIHCTQYRCSHLGPDHVQVFWKHKWTLMLPKHLHMIRPLQTVIYEWDISFMNYSLYSRFVLHIRIVLKEINTFHLSHFWFYSNNIHIYNWHIMMARQLLS